MQGVVVIDLVADEIDAGDAGGRPFGDREDQIDAVLRPLDDLRIDAGGEFAVAAIEFDDALDIGLHLGAGEDAARLDLDFLVRSLVETLSLPSNTTWLMIGIFDHLDRQGAVPLKLILTSENRPVPNSDFNARSTVAGS